MATLQVGDKICKKSVRIIKEVLIKIDKFLFLVDFIVLDIEADPKISLILGRPSMNTPKMYVDIDKGQVSVRIKYREMCFKVKGIS